MKNSANSDLFSNRMRFPWRKMENGGWKMEDEDVIHLCSWPLGSLRLLNLGAAPPGHMAARKETIEILQFIHEIKKFVTFFPEQISKTNLIL
jgi:hypothetical protein